MCSVQFLAGPVPIHGVQIGQSNHTETPTFSAAEKVTWVRATRTEVAINMDRDRQWMLHPGVQDSRCSVICRALGFFIFFSSWTLVCLVHHNNHITLDAPKISYQICANLRALVMYDPPSTSRVEWDEGKTVLCRKKCASSCRRGSNLSHRFSAQNSTQLSA